jgi:glycosyltransferase involved in cell wall biosynthesis
MAKCSIVVPVHNEEGSITILYDGLKSALETTGDRFECIFVDDGSSDGTFRLLEEIASVDSRVIVVRLRRNFGKTAALTAGFNEASGDYIVTMDGDLQHDPNDIPRFLEKLEEGYDVVCGWRHRRVDNFWLRRIPSRVANWVMAKVSGVDIHDFGGGFKAYRRELLREVPIYGELQRFIPALASWNGARICEVPIKNVPRRFGSSHYGISRALPVFFDLITIRFLLRYLSRPLHFFGTLGMLSMLSGGAIGLWLLGKKLLLGASIMGQHGPLMIFGAVLILAGVQLLALGLLGEMQARHYHGAAGQTSYSVERVLRTDEQASGSRL